VSRLALPIRAAAQRVALPFLIFLSVMLVVLGKADIVLFDRARTSVSDALAPILDEALLELRRRQPLKNLHQLGRFDNHRHGQILRGLIRLPSPLRSELTQPRLQQSNVHGGAVWHRPAKQKLRPDFINKVLNLLIGSRSRGYPPLWTRPNWRRQAVTQAWPRTRKGPNLRTF